MNPVDYTKPALVASIRFMLRAIADLEDNEVEESRELTEPCREEMQVLLDEYQRLLRHARRVFIWKCRKLLLVRLN